MEKRVLYLEIDEEITSVAEKLRKTAETDIYLVVPKEAALLQSIINLKLLKRQADTLKKEIQIITHDKVGRNLAEQVGINSASRMDDISEKPDIPPLTVAPPMTEIMMKEKDSPLEETKEVVFKKGSVVDMEEPNDRTTEQLNSEETEEPDGGTTEDQDKTGEEGGKKDKQRTGDLLPKFPYKKFLIIATVLLVVLSGLFYIFIPMTNINLTIASEKKDMKANITVDKSATAINQSAGVVPGNYISLEKTITKSYPATGKKNIGTKTQGKITVSNSYSDIDQTLVAGTRFESNGLIFRTTADVDVPGLTIPAGDIIPGTVEVTVVADAPGAKYNIEPGILTIPGFSGTAKFEKIKGANTVALVGGSDKEVTIITDADISKAKVSFGEDATTEIKKEGEAKKKEGEVLDAKAEKIDIATVTLSKNSGDETDKFEVSGKAVFKGLAFKEEDIKKISFENFKSSVPTSKQALEDKLSNVDIVINDVDLEKGTISVESNGSIHLGTKVNTNQIKDEILGYNQTKAKQYLEGLDGVSAVKVEFWPSFMKSVSRLKSHIYIKTQFVESK